MKKMRVYFYPQDKVTQGNTKLNQYLEDLLRNKIFQDKVKELNTEWTKKDLSRADLLWVPPKQLKKFSDDFESLKKFVYKDSIRYINLVYEIAEEYGICDVLLLPKLTQNKKQNFLKRYMKVRLEMCEIVDEYAKNLNKDIPPTPIQFDIEKQSFIRAFPINIAVHRFATKNDILDYVENNWKEIEKQLDHYRNKSVRLRKRGLDRKIVDYIWKNKSLNRVEISTMVKKKFPEVSLQYFEISKIISLEKKRREKKIIVGQ